MKLLTMFLLAIVSMGYSQSAKYGELTKKSEYDYCQSKNGYEIKVGDTIVLGVPTSDLGFTYISQNGQRVSNSLAGNTILIDKLRTYGTKKSGYKIYAYFKGYGLLPVLIDYETALELGEILNPDGSLTRDQAISKLKEAKELLDLGVIASEEYNTLKKELTPLIID